MNPENGFFFFFNILGEKLKLLSCRPYRFPFEQTILSFFRKEIKVSWIFLFHSTFQLGLKENIHKVLLGNSC